MGAKMTTIISLPGVSRMHDKLCREHLSEQEMGSKYMQGIFSLSSGPEVVGLFEAAPFRGSESSLSLGLLHYLI